MSGAGVGAGRSILLVAHALPPQETTGTPLATYGYATALAEAGWAVTVVVASPDAPPWDALRVVRRAGEFFDRVPVRPLTRFGSMWTLDAPTQPGPVPLPPTALLSAGALGDDPTLATKVLLRQIAAQVVHIVDNVNLPLAIPEAAHHAGIPVVRTVSCAEDLCAFVAPVSSCSGPSGFCAPPLSIERCATCVGATSGAPWSDLARTGQPVADEQHRQRVRRLLAAKRARAVRHFSEVYDRVVFASERFRSYFEETLPLDPERVRVIPMGIDVVGKSTEHSAHRVPEADAPLGAGAGPAAGAPAPLTFLLAAIGDPAKGIDAVVTAFSHPELSGRSDWRLVLAGGGNRSLYGPLLCDPRVSDHGPYHPAELPQLLGRADVGLSTSVFETFHRVTREYLVGGLPVVGSSAFGITDVVVHGRNGLLFDHAESGSLRRAVVALLSDRAMVGRLAAGARATPVRSVADEVEELQAIYSELIDRPAAVAQSLRQPAR